MADWGKENVSTPAFGRKAHSSLLVCSVLRPLALSGNTPAFSEILTPDEMTEKAVFHQRRHDR